ncbi:AAA family ATPase [Nocardioides ferulae]|uniref:AAA family ATPase n=1 Tax=Nocardioides ferulae TaxID=2340821 RepID=UPI000EB1C54B|nr:AAA family ATPase [Nocardioides ferulae]
MPVLVEPESTTVATLMPALPAGSHAVDSPRPLEAWLTQHTEEYVVVLGPHVPLEEALATCEELRISRPTVSVVLVRESLDTHVLAAAMKAGARDVVPLDDPASVGAAVGRAHQLWVALRGPGGARPSGQVVTVFSPKGGVGKTTLAVNLALALGAHGARKVCLVDLDLAFGDVAITLQLFPTHSIEHAIGAEDSLDPGMLEGLLTRHPDSLMVLAAPAHPDARERVTATLVARTLRILREEFDFVVVDTAPAFDEQTLTALDETDECVLVATLDVPTLKNVKVALETLDMLNIARGHRHLMLNRADDQVGISADKVEAILGLPVTARIATSVEIAAATNAGTPIVLGKPEHPSSQAIRSLATRFAGEVATPPATAHGAGLGTHTAEPERSGRRFKLRR